MIGCWFSLSSIAPEAKAVPTAAAARTPAPAMVMMMVRRFMGTACTYPPDAFLTRGCRAVSVGSGGRGKLVG